MSKSLNDSVAGRIFLLQVVIFVVLTCDPKLR